MNFIVIVGGPTGVEMGRCHRGIGEARIGCRFLLHRFTPRTDRSGRGGPLAAGTFRSVYRISQPADWRSELVLAVATTVAVLGLGVLYGVLLAIVLSILDIVRRIARPHIEQQRADES